MYPQKIHTIIFGRKIYTIRLTMGIFPAILKNCFPHIEQKFFTGATNHSLDININLKSKMAKNILCIDNSPKFNSSSHNCLSSSLNNYSYNVDNIFLLLQFIMKSTLYQYLWRIYKHFCVTEKFKNTSIDILYLIARIIKLKVFLTLRLFITYFLYEIIKDMNETKKNF